jgi:hypothetical protein
MLLGHPSVPPNVLAASRFPAILPERDTAFKTVQASRPTGGVFTELSIFSWAGTSAEGQHAKTRFAVTVYPLP